MGIQKVVLPSFFKLIFETNFSEPGFYKLCRTPIHIAWVATHGMQKTAASRRKLTYSVKKIDLKNRNFDVFNNDNYLLILIQNFIFLHSFSRIYIPLSGRRAKLSVAKRSRDPADSGKSR